MAGTKPPKSQALPKTAPSLSAGLPRYRPKAPRQPPVIPVRPPQVSGTASHPVSFPLLSSNPCQFSSLQLPDLVIDTDPYASRIRIIDKGIVRAKLKSSQPFHIIHIFNVRGIPDIVPSPCQLTEALHHFPVVVPGKFIAVSPHIHQI